jgi:hypothetical protein
MESRQLCKANATHQELSKRKYASPKLMEYGSLADLTRDQLTGMELDGGTVPLAYSGEV